MTKGRLNNDTYRSSKEEGKLMCRVKPPVCLHPLFIHSIKNVMVTIQIESFSNTCILHACSACQCGRGCF